MFMFRLKKPLNEIILAVDKQPGAIESIDLSGYRAGKQGLDRLFNKLIAEKKTVYTLDLSGNLLEATAFEHLLPKLIKLEVKQIKLASNQLSDKNVDSLLSLLRTNQLELIDISRNYFTPSAVTRFLEGCLESESLTSIMADKRNLPEGLIEALEAKICQNAHGPTYSP